MIRRGRGCIPFVAMEKVRNRMKSKEINGVLLDHDGDDVPTRDGKEKGYGVPVGAIGAVGVTSLQTVWRA
jgi:hypothetical protein